MSIANAGMVVNLQVGFWLGYRLDKDATKQVTEQAGAQADAARVNKHLVPKETLKGVTSAGDAIRRHFYELTLPWKDNGDRLLPRKVYEKFMPEHGALVATFNAEAQKFIEVEYLQARELAAFRMGTLFNPRDYPDPRSLRSKFYVNLDIDAVTIANDFRIEMEQEEVDRIRTSMEQATEARINRAMRDVWTRLADTVGKVAERLDDTDKKFRDATITNLEELVDILPSLNILDDPDLERIRVEVKQRLTGITPDTLRKDFNVRAQVAGDAKRIMDEMSGFMSAFGGLIDQ